CQLLGYITVVRSLDINKRQTQFVLLEDTALLRETVVVGGLPYAYTKAKKQIWSPFGSLKRFLKRSIKGNR
ncbi:MAG TPA: hypothetical protein VF691_19835, partial [Cytophagaceae bacterium]